MEGGADDCGAVFADDESDILELGNGGGGGAPADGKGGADGAPVGGKGGGGGAPEEGNGGFGAEEAGSGGGGGADVVGMGGGGGAGDVGSEGTAGDLSSSKELIEFTELDFKCDDFFGLLGGILGGTFKPALVF